MSPIALVKNSLAPPKSLTSFSLKLMLKLDFQVKSSLSILIVFKTNSYPLLTNVPTLVNATSKPVVAGIGLFNNKLVVSLL